MSEHEQRLWGIDVIAGIYGLATLLFLWLCFNATGAALTFGMVMTPICAALAIGIGARNNIVRIALMILLCIALVGDTLFIVYYVGAIADFFRAPPNKDPLDELLRVAFRTAATMSMLLYLKRPDVAEAFQPWRRKRVREDVVIDDFSTGDVDV